jgi:hypothetical protein
MNYALNMTSPKWREVSRASTLKDIKSEQICFLDSDVAQALPTDASLNEELRLLLQIVQHQQSK